jgi:hypothetical protein
VLKDRYSNRELRAVLMRLAEQGREQSALCRLEPRDIEHTAEEVFAAGAEMGADRAGIEEAMAAAGEEAAPDSCAVPPPLCSDRRRDDQETSGHVVFDCNDWRTRAGSSPSIGTLLGVGDQVASADAVAALRRFVTSFRTVSDDPGQTLEANETALAMVVHDGRRAVFSDSIARSPLERALHWYGGCACRSGGEGSLGEERLAGALARSRQRRQQSARHEPLGGQVQSADENRSRRDVGSRDQEEPRRDCRLRLAMDPGALK